jgi:hypothetical protein
MAISGADASVLALGGWTIADMLSMSAEATIDRYRFASLSDRVLSRHEDVPALMPSADELSFMGVDIVGLARALEAGLNPELFGQVVGMLDIASFNEELAAGLNVSLYNEGMDHLSDVASMYAAHPQRIDQILCRYGDCGGVSCSN